MKAFERHVHFLGPVHGKSRRRLCLTAPVASHPQPLNTSLLCTSKGDLRQMDAAVWALLSNTSSSRAASPLLSSPFYSKHSSKSSSSRYSSSSSARWSSLDPSPLPPQSSLSSSVRPTKPQHYSPGRAPHLQVLAVKIALRDFFCVVFV